MEDRRPVLIHATAVALPTGKDGASDDRAGVLLCAPARIAGQTAIAGDIGALDTVAVS
jgi:hypothetical protein